MKPTNLLFTYLLLLLAFTYIGNTNTYAADRQPNVVLLLADDLGY